VVNRPISAGETREAAHLGLALHGELMEVNWCEATEVQTVPEGFGDL
jgi:hypothetical protein